VPDIAVRDWQSTPMISKEPPMPNKSLVLVLGAGSSEEVDLPVGAELKRQIAERLDIRFQDYARQPGSGDDKLLQAFRLASVRSDGSQGDINQLLDVSRLIRDAMPQAISIDNFIDSHRNDERIAFCGKLAIARCILEAEARSKLLVDRSNIYNKLDFGAIENTWFNAFFQLLTENCQKEDIPARLKKIAVISFNYDRCLEHYLYLALQNYYGILAAEAASMLAFLEVHHPYGKVGALPWMSQSGAIEYGATPTPDQLIVISKLLRTFTEGTDPSVSHINTIRATVADTERLLFLGFAFHRLNLDLLFPEPPSGVRSGTKSVFATAYGLSRSNSKQIRLELVNKARHPSEDIYLRDDLTCVQLFSEFSRSLALD
jgi:hypothetical protein